MKKTAQSRVAMAAEVLSRVAIAADALVRVAAVALVDRGVAFGRRRAMGAGKGFAIVVVSIILR